MPNSLITDVEPGDLITSALWNALRGKVIALEAQVQQLSGSVGTGNVIVPEVFGRTLKQARGLITVPALQLVVGFVIDAFGKPVDISQSASDALIVIGQMPAAGARVSAGTSINLAVSAAASGVVEPPKLPNITGFNPIPVPAGTEVTIGGENFSSTTSDITLTFDGVATPVNSSTPTTIRAVVPKTMPNGPNKVGDQTNNGVKVHLVVKGSATDATCSVSAPLSDAASPFIDSITPNPGVFTQDLTIIGTGFSANKDDHRVTFSGKPAEGVIPKTATPTTLTLSLPDSLKAEFTTVPGLKQFDVVVTTKSVKSNTKPHNILRVT
jgi:IPT/TIG domain-containing protein